MAIFKRNARENLTQGINKLALERILNDNIIQENAKSLNGKTTGPGVDKVSKFINDQYKSSAADFYKANEEKINSLIDDEMVFAVNQTVKAYQSKQSLENDISRLKQELKWTQKEESFDRFKIDSLEMQIEDKEEAFEEKKKEFKDLYRAALKNTVISRDLADMFSEIRAIEEEQRFQIAIEIEKQSAKLNALKLLRINMLDDTEIMVENRLNHLAGLIGRKAVESSRSQVPLIKNIL